MTVARVPYAGVASRGVALAIDVLIVHVIVLTGGAVVALVASLVGDVRLDSLAEFLAAVAWAAVVGIYFVLFWSTAGQTPGMRLLGLRVIGRDGDHPGLAASIVRLVGLALAIVPFFAGFLPVLVDDRRRALQDFLARTVVVYDTDGDARREARRSPGGVQALTATHRTAPLHERPARPRITREPTSDRGAHT